LSPSPIKLPLVEQNPTYIHTYVRGVESASLNLLSVSAVVKAKKYGKNYNAYGNARCKMRFGVRALASVYTYNPQALYCSKKFTLIFSTVVIFADFWFFSAVAEIFAIKIPLCNPYHYQSVTNFYLKRLFTVVFYFFMG